MIASESDFNPIEEAPFVLKHKFVSELFLSNPLLSAEKPGSDMLFNRKLNCVSVLFLAKKDPNAAAPAPPKEK